jgi:AbrB family looped-hinge helix DNA binding protein
MTRQIQATVTKESQLPLPAEVLERLGLAEGSVVTFLLTDDEVVLLNTPQSIEDLFGSIPALPHSSEDFDDEIEAAIEVALRAYGR